MDFIILKDIVIIFALSTVVNFLFTRIKVPTIIGYMLTGILAGPYLLGLIQSEHEIELMAEIGVVLLMFTIGLEFSLQQLLKIRKLVFFGGFFQFALTAGFIFLISRMYELDYKSGLFIGFLTALSSTAIVLKLLQERSELTSNYGKTVLGILIFQDIMLVPLILFSNILGGDSVEVGKEIFLLVAKVIGMLVFIFVGSKWLVPWLLKQIVKSKNQELFLMSIFLMCMSVALLTWELGMSLAFGAFIAGLMISGSTYSHSVFGNLVPFKNMFTSFFFVSIGMLLNLNYLAENIWLVTGTLLLVITIKTFVAGGAGFMLGHTFRGTVMVGLALSQVGEFSFILAKIGLSSGLLSENYFQLFLSVAVLSMSITPFMMSVARPLSNVLLKLPLPKIWVNGLFPLKEIPVPDYKGHMVIIGKDTRSQKLALLSKKQDIPFITIAFDPAVVKERQKSGEPVIYGDAMNEPILLKAHVDSAEIVVISVGNMVATSAILEKIRNINQNAYIIARAKHISDMELLYEQGANHVVPEEFETTLEFFHQILKKRLVPLRDITKILEPIREDHYGVFMEDRKAENNWFFEELPEFEINAFKVEDGSEIQNKSLKEINLRSVAGVTLLAIKRNDLIIEHPESTEKIKQDDCLYLLGRPEKLTTARELLITKQVDVP